MAQPERLSQRERDMKTTWLAVGLVAALSAGCAGTQRLGQTSGTGPENEVEGKSGPHDVNVADPLAAGAKKPTGSTQKRTITEGQQNDFAKAVRRWEAARRDGSLKNDCGSIASAFGSVADDNPAILEARGNQAAVLAECGRDAEANAIWEKLASGPKPYAPALAQLGYAAWKSGDVVRAETLFNRSVEADKLLGSVSARLNLAQILRDKARNSSSVEEKNRLTLDAIVHLRAVLASDGNNLQAYATLCYFYYDLQLLEMARLVGTQAILRAEEIATGKLVGQREKLASSERATAPAKGKGAKGKGAAADDAAAEAPAASNVVGTGYTPEMKKALGMVYNTLGLVWLKRKDVSQAIASFRKAVDQDPDLFEARLNLAALSLNYRDYATAEQNFRAVLNTQPKNYAAVIGLGVALRGNRKFDEAEQQYLAAQQLDPQNADSYFNLGLLYQEYKGTDKANLLKAQQFYRDFLGRTRSSGKKKEAEKRIKDIDDTMAALEEAAKMQKEAEELQKKADEQQKKMEEEMKKLQEQEKQQQGGAPASQAPASPPPATAAAPAKGAS
jgi:tetratricopeptide (TPR) repeat protein